MIRSITETFAVAPQISADHVPEIAKLGFKSIICNRPDHEEPGQPSADAIKAAAKAAGLSFAFVPMSNQTGLQPDIIADMKTALGDLPTPILAYCRSGTRSTHLYMAAERSV